MGKLGVRHWTAQDDAVLVAGSERGLSNRQIGDLLGRSRQAVNARRHLLRRGLRKRPWTPQEDALLVAAAGYRSAVDLGRELGRTSGAVNSRACALGIRWGGQTNGRHHTGFTASDVARILGIADSKRVAWWIRAGYLTGTRRAIRLAADPTQTSARAVPWRVMPDALRAFLRDYPWLYARERITDRGWAAYVATLPRETWLTVGQTAERLCMTREGVNKIIRQGYLRAEKRGPNWLVPLSAIQTYVPPPIGGGAVARQVELAARRARTLAQRKTRGYQSRPETVARQVAARANRRERAA